MEHSKHADSIFDWFVEDQVALAYRFTAQVFTILKLWNPQIGLCGKSLNHIVDIICDFVRPHRIVLGDVVPNIGEISVCFASQNNARHLRRPDSVLPVHAVEERIDVPINHVTRIRLIETDL